MNRAPHLTRRQMMKAAGGLAVLGGGGILGEELLSGAPAARRLPGSVSRAPGPVRSFPSRPDLRPTAVAVSGATDQPGYLLVDPSWSNVGSQSGPLILDDHGDPVWFSPLSGSLATNLKTQAYRGQPALSWWEGKVVALNTYYGQGEGVIVDNAYRELTRVRAANGRRMDLHEFRLTPDGTALFTCFPEIAQTDLSSLGGPSDAAVINSIVQEIDLHTGRLLLEWRSLDHIHPSESYRPMDEPWDFLHANSVTLTADGQLLISGRETCSLYKVDRRSGAVIWRLGGKRSDFAIDPDARFSFQHHALPIEDNVISVFDNASDGAQRHRSQSRGVLLEVDYAGRKVRLGQAFAHSQDPLTSSAEGSVEVLPDGHVLVGWGTNPYVSEFAPDGALTSDVHFLAPAGSYRAHRMPWRGQPRDEPAIAVAREHGKRTLYVSWNGATEVRYWRVHAGGEARNLPSVGIARRRGFETVIPLGHASGYVAATALDGAGDPLATSRPVRL